MSELQGLKERFAWYQDRLNDASGRFGGVTICAATKTQSAETVNAAYDKTNGDDPDGICRRPA